MGGKVNGAVVTTCTRRAVNRGAALNLGEALGWHVGDTVGVFGAALGAARAGARNIYLNMAVGPLDRFDKTALSETWTSNKFRERYRYKLPTNRRRVNRRNRDARAGGYYKQVIDVMLGRAVISTAREPSGYRLFAIERACRKDLHREKHRLEEIPTLKNRHQADAPANDETRPIATLVKWQRHL